VLSVARVSGVGTPRTASAAVHAPPHRPGLPSTNGVRQGAGCLSVARCPASVHYVRRQRPCTPRRTGPGLPSTDGVCQEQGVERGEGPASVHHTRRQRPCAPPPRRPELPFTVARVRGQGVERGEGVPHLKTSRSAFVVSDEMVSNVYLSSVGRAR